MITIKGLRDGLLVIFDQQPWLTQVRELESKLEANAHFFKGGRIALDVRALALSRDEIKRVDTLLTQHEVSLWAILSQDESTRHTIKAFGFATSLAEQSQPVAEPSGAESEQNAAENTVTEGTDGLLARKRVRSGQILRHPGHIVVIGDVNPGAQLIAGGDIIVWGKLHGVAHAGALGDNSAVICALELMPSLLKIADATRTSSPLSQKRGRIKQPETAMLELQEIKITSWREK